VSAQRSRARPVGEPARRDNQLTFQVVFPQLSQVTAKQASTTLITATECIVFERIRFRCRGMNNAGSKGASTTVENEVGRAGADGATEAAVHRLYTPLAVVDNEKPSYAWRSYTETSGHYGSEQLLPDNFANHIILSKNVQNIICKSLRGYRPWHSTLGDLPLAPTHHLLLP
jgi:hypothetical protein